MNLCIRRPRGFLETVRGASLVVPIYMLTIGSVLSLSLSPCAHSTRSRRGTVTWCSFSTPHSAVKLRIASPGLRTTGTPGSLSRKLSPVGPSTLTSTTGCFSHRLPTAAPTRLLTTDANQSQPTCHRRQGGLGSLMWL